MMNGYKRFTERERKSLGKVYTHKQSSYKTGGEGYSHRVNIAVGSSRAAERLGADGGYCLGVAP